MQRALLFSAVTLFVLYLFQPFGTQNDHSSFKYLRLSGYGLVTFCALLISGYLEIALSRMKLDGKFRTLLVPSLHIGLVAVFNHSYFVVAILGTWHWQNQSLFVFYTLAIGLFPVGFMYLVNRHSNTLITSAEATTAQAKTMIENADHPSFGPSSNITLVGENKDDLVQVSISQIVFIKSADNYCELNLRIDEKCSTKLLRCSLSKLIAQLPQGASLTRCHRSFAVNLDLVESCQGNAAGLQLSMQAGGFVVPVSRSYVDRIKQALPLAPKAC